MKNIRIKTVLLQADTVNKNGRVYTNEAIRTMIEQFHKNGAMCLGELVHNYEDTNDFNAVDMSKAGCVINKLKHVDDKLIGEFTLVHTDSIEKILNGPKKSFVCRPRSIGSIINGNEVEIEQVISYDIIPAHIDSFGGIGKFELGMTRWQRFKAKIKKIFGYEKNKTNKTWFGRKPS